MLDFRKRMNEPLVFGGFDYLVSELAKRESQLRKDKEDMIERSKVTPNA